MYAADLSHDAANLVYIMPTNNPALPDLRLGDPTKHVTPPRDSLVRASRTTRIGQLSLT
jgi:hypothetical protein